MTKLGLIVVLAGALAVSGSIAAAQSIAVAPAADDNETVCKRLDPPTGSHLPQPPVCHTKAEWKEMQNAGQNAVQQLQQTGTMHNIPGG